MALVNASKPTTTLANITKVSFAELWSTITTTWATETRLWDDTGSIISNTDVSGQTLWANKSLPWRATAPWQTVGDFISNTAKPV